jgi:hypothetical protein
MAPNDLFSWNNKYNKYNEYNVTDTLTCFFLDYAHHLLCACWHLEAMKGSSSLTSCRLPILSRLSSSLIWAQLTLLVPTSGVRSPLSKMATPFTGSAHTPLPGSGTRILLWSAKFPGKNRLLSTFLYIWNYFGEKCEFWTVFRHFCGLFFGVHSNSGKYIEKILQKSGQLKIMDHPPVVCLIQVI